MCIRGKIPPFNSELSALQTLSWSSLVTPLQQIQSCCYITQPESFLLTTLMCTSAVSPLSQTCAESKSSASGSDQNFSGAAAAGLNSLGKFSTVQA